MSRASASLRFLTSSRLAPVLRQAASVDCVIPRDVAPPWSEGSSTKPPSDFRTFSIASSKPMPRSSGVLRAGRRSTVVERLQPKFGSAPQDDDRTFGAWKDLYPLDTC